MAGGIWTPSTTLLGTVKEFQSFSYSASYYEESTGEAGADGTPGATTKTYFPVRIIAASPVATVICTDQSVTWTAPTVGSTNYTAVLGPDASVAGYFKYIYFDVLQYKDFSGNIKTLTGTETKGTWEMFDPNDCYQVIRFTPDAVRHRTFVYTFEAYTKSADGSIVVVSSQDYTIDVSDRNWDPGKAALQNVVALIKSRLQ